jgi:CHASE3 domain sensor protein
MNISLGHETVTALEDLMERDEIDKLVSDIQDYLNDVERQAGGTVRRLTENQETAHNGAFIPAKSRGRMNRFLKYSRFASYAVEVLTIGLFTAGVMFPFISWSVTVMFLMGVLLFGIFAITVLFGLQTRVRLLLRIESNTRRVALSKERIADALENIRIG